ncbi:MAG TPA: type II toxin-antitoxin system prevent-host-death family antitoxin [Chloroflexota bacterium]
MKRIGVRELRQYASTWLHQVEQGESFEITDRGRPVALLVPVRSNDLLERLIASGRLSIAERDVLDLGEPLPPMPGKILPSEALEQARADER